VSDQREIPITSTSEAPERARPVLVYDEREFYGRELQWIEYRKDGWMILHFGGEYQIDVHRPPRLRFRVPVEQ
jgi:hypothetical protein